MSINKFVARLSLRQVNIITCFLTPIRYLAEFIDFFYPKDRNLVVFGSNTGEFMSGSPKALFEHIEKRHPQYQCYYYLPFERPLTIYRRIKYIIKFASIFFKAKFLVSSHPSSGFYPFSWSSRKVFINTWHGTPLKSMFFADSGDTKNNLKEIRHLDKKISAFVVSSKIEAAMLTECFLINPRKFYYLGQPRNDVLLRANDNNSHILRHTIPNIPEHDKSILYCPTYRRGNTTRFFPFADFDLEHLNNFLRENKIVLLFRGHVYHRGKEQRYFSERIINFSFDVCNDVNSILPEVDMLVTDYSSIYIDYLLLDRPCIFVPYDLEEYKAKRGLLFDDYDFWAPGHKVLTYKQFIAAIEEILSGKDAYGDRRREVNRQLNYHQADNACEKVFELIDKWGRISE